MASFGLIILRQGWDRGRGHTDWQQGLNCYNIAVNTDFKVQMGTDEDPLGVESQILVR